MSFGATRVPIRAVTAAVLLSGALGVSGIACGSSGSTASSTSERSGTSTSPPETTTSASSTTGDPGSAPSPSTTAGVSPTSVTPTVPGRPPTTAEGDVELLAPSGTFLSTHRLSLTGQGAPSQARSVCRTSPGATCGITFTKGGVTRSLPTKAVDGAGSTAWDWKPSDVGLSVGHWDVRITAAKGSKKRSVDEAIGLDVQ